MKYGNIAIANIYCVNLNPTAGREEPMIHPFRDGDAFPTFQKMIEKVVEEIQSLNNEYILKASQTELEDFYVEKAILTPILLHTDKYCIENQISVPIDVSNNFQRFTMSAQKITVSGTSLDIAIPYEGDSDLWKIRPSSYSVSGYPEIEIREHEIVFNIRFADDSVNTLDLKNRINRHVLDLACAIETLKSDIEKHNKNVPNRIKDALCCKRKQAETAIGSVLALGIPMKRRDQPLTFTVATQRRKSPKCRPKVHTEVYKPEPTLDEEEYQYILKVIRGMSLVIERSPSSFITLDEEAIRTHFLLQLNGHYEGNASGETFNASGKTDILIKVDNKNIFIAECKFWDGVKKFNEAIDQLLGYLSWRDSKCALLIFNRTKNSSSVRKKMHDAMEHRAEHRKTVSCNPDNDARYVFVKESDLGREIIITTQLYDMPNHLDLQQINKAD